MLQFLWALFAFLVQEQSVGIRHSMHLSKKGWVKPDFTGKVRLCLYSAFVMLGRLNKVQLCEVGEMEMALPFASNNVKNAARI